MCLFLVDVDTKGFHAERKLKKLGLKGQYTAELFFENVSVPGSVLFSKENAGLYPLSDDERLGQAGESFREDSIRPADSVAQVGRAEDFYQCLQSLPRPVSGAA